MRSRNSGARLARLRRGRNEGGGGHYQTDLIGSRAHRAGLEVDRVICLGIVLALLLFRIVP